MKTTNALLIAVILTAIAVSILKGEAEPQQNPGRFQIIQGDYISISDGHSINDKGMFKIDTTTGKTWLFVLGLSKGQYVQKWTPVTD